MRENLMSGSMWQGMKTRHGDGTEALSEEMESNGSATPKSRRHPLTLPADMWDRRVFWQFSTTRQNSVFEPCPHPPTCG